MTLQRLSQHLSLREKLERNKEILASLQATAAPGAQVLTGMPRTPGVKDKVGDLAIEIADMQARIEYLQWEIEEEERDIVNPFLNSISDDRIRMMFRLRFIRCLTWGEVATVIGGRNTEDGIKSACYRFLQTESCNAVTRDDA